VSRPTARTCSRRDGLVVGRCGGKLHALTLVAGVGKMRTRLWCERCNRPASDKREP
jgi:hypothetical protein